MKYGGMFCYDTAQKWKTPFKARFPCNFWRNVYHRTHCFYEYQGKTNDCPTKEIATGRYGTVRLKWKTGLSRVVAKCTVLHCFMTIRARLTKEIGIRYGTVRYGTVRCGVVWYGVSYRMV